MGRRAAKGGGGGLKRLSEAMPTPTQHANTSRDLYRQLFGPPALPARRRRTPSLVLRLPLPPAGGPVPDQIRLTAYADGEPLWDAWATPTAFSD